MNDKVKLIIEIPKMALEVLNTTGVDWLGAEHILSAVSHGIPIDNIKAKIKAREMVETNIERQFYNMALSDAIEILDSIGTGK